MEKKPLTRRERQLKLRQIAREYDEKKRELGLRAPALQRGPAFYLVLIIVLGAIGAAVIQAAGKGGGRQLPDARIHRARVSVNALAEALGRFKFHCGTYPQTTDGGLDALARKSSCYPGWIGPYASRIVNDPWGRAYVYETPTDDGEPVVLSLGPDGKRGTADDIAPDPALFAKPFRDVAWTNDWVHFSKRGIIVVPRK